MKQSVTPRYKVMFLASLCVLGLIAGVIHLIRSVPGSEVILMSALLFSGGVHLSVAICCISITYLAHTVRATNMSRLRWTAELIVSLVLIVVSGYAALALYGKHREIDQIEKNFIICEQRNLSPEACDRALLKLQKENSA